MGTYIQPQVQVFQEFTQLPVNVVANQNAFVFGPNYQLFRYSQPTEKALIALGAYNAEAAQTYAYPNQPAASSVDLSYVKLTMEDVLAQYAVIGAGATTPLVVVSNTERNKLRAMPKIDTLELQTVHDTGVTADVGGYFNAGPNLPDALYFWPTGGAESDFMSILPADTATLAYRTGISGNTGTVAVPSNAMTEGVKVEGPFGLMFNFGSTVTTSTRTAGAISFTGKPSNGNAITIAGTAFTFKTSPTGIHDVLIGSTAQDCYQNLRYAVETAALANVSSVVILPGATTAAGMMYVIGYGTGTPALTSSTLAHATLAVGPAGAALEFNSMRQPVVLTFKDAAQTGYFTFQVDPLQLPVAIDHGIDAGKPVTVETVLGSTLGVSWSSANAKLTITIVSASTTLADLREALMANSDVAALFNAGEIGGVSTAKVSAAYDEANFYFADGYNIVMVPDAYRVKVVPNEVTFAAGNGFVASAANFLTRGVRVGDALRYSVVGTDSAVYTGITRVAGFEADTLASVVEPPVVGGTNAATQTSDDLSLITSLTIAANADSQRKFTGYVTALDSVVQVFPGSYNAGVLDDNYTVTVSVGGLAGSAYATVTSDSGMYTRRNVPIVAKAGTIGALYIGTNMVMNFTKGPAADEIFQFGDSYTFSDNALAPFAAQAASKLVVGGNYTGPRDTTYRLEVSRGGVFDRTINVIPGLGLLTAATLTVVVDWDNWLPGDADDEYILVCTKAGTITTAQFALQSQRSDNVSTFQFSGSGSVYTRTLGAQGLECYMTTSASFTLGDSWVVRVNGARPQVRITDSAGIDQNKIITIDSGLTFDVGLYGIVGEFLGNVNTLGGFAPSGGMELGDVFYVSAYAQSAGPLKTLVLADDLPELVTTGFMVDNTGAVPVSTPNYTPTAFSTWYYLAQTTAQIGSERVQTPPEFNWTASLTEFAVNSGIQVQDGSWVGLDGELPWINVYSASMFVEYRALLSSYSDAIYSLTSTNDVVTELGTIHPDNPLAQGVYNALLNSGSQPVYFMAVPTNDLDGYAAVLDQAGKTSNVYCLVPLSLDSQVQDAVEGHINNLSTATAKRWRTGAMGINMISAVAKVNSATYPTPGTDWTATITRNSAAIGTAYTLVTFTNGTPNLLANVKAGDQVRANFQMDAWGVATYDTYTVASVKSNTQLLLTSGPSAPLSVAGKTEVWHSYTTAQLADQIAAQASHFSNRRVIAVFPWVAYTAGVAQTAEFISAAIAGLASSTPPQQGLTNISLVGFDDIPLVYSTFTNDQLNTMAAGGAFIVTQDSAGGTVYVRHQITSASPQGNLYTSELSITRNLDAISYFFANTLAPFVGRYNITPDLIAVIDTQIRDGLNYLMGPQTAVGLLGPMVINSVNTKINYVQQDPTLKDHINASVDLDLPIPANVIQLHLIV